MTDEQMNAAIAEACGWTEIHDSGPWHNHKPWGYPPQPLGTGGNAYKYVPDYCTDLNAMFEAEKTLKIGYCKEYKDNLYDAALELEKKTRRWMPYSLPARQRAEAFLRTLGKWSATDKDSLTVQDVGWPPPGTRCSKMNADGKWEEVQG